MYQVTKIPYQRKHTLAFLDLAKEHQSVYLHTEIDATNLLINISHNQSNGYLAWLIYVISNVLKKYPRANSYYRTGLLRNIIEYNEVYAKFTIDKTLSNERIVLSGIIPRSEKIAVNQIQEQINKYKNMNPNDVNIFKEIKILHKLPLFIGKKIMALAHKNPKKSAMIQGTFSISSLGKSEISSFFPVTTTTLGFGVGRLQHKFVAIDEKNNTKPYLPLIMSFDHRVIDGAFAGEILGEIKLQLENLNLGDDYV